MSIYVVRDIYCNMSGDIQIDAKGDIKLADSYESHKAAVNFLIKTDKGEYAPDKRIGCDLGAFIGKNNDESTQVAMEHTILDNVTRFVLDRSDINVHVIPMSPNDAGVFAVIGGQFLDSVSGNLLDPDPRPEVLTYLFPYAEGEPRILGA
jgi:hypothetical protein